MDASLFPFSASLPLPLQEVHIATLSLLRPRGRLRTGKVFQFVREVPDGRTAHLGKDQMTALV